MGFHRSTPWPTSFTKYFGIVPKKTVAWQHVRRPLLPQPLNLLLMSLRVRVVLRAQVLCEPDDGVALKQACLYQPCNVFQRAVLVYIHERGIGVEVRSAASLVLHSTIEPINVPENAAHRVCVRTEGIHAWRGLVLQIAMRACWAHS